LWRIIRFSGSPSNHVLIGQHVARQVAPEVGIGRVRRSESMQRPAAAGQILYPSLVACRVAELAGSE